MRYNSNEIKYLQNIGFGHDMVGNGTHSKMIMWVMTKDFEFTIYKIGDESYKIKRSNISSYDLICGFDKLKMFIESVIRG